METKTNLNLKGHYSNEKQQIIEKCFYDIEAFSDCFFRPTHIKQEYNALHKAYFKSFNPIEKGRHLVIQASRGSAKTTFICLIDVMHRICYNTDKYIIILSSTKPLATAKTNDIFEEINENDLLREFYGLKMKNKRTAKEAFIVTSIFGECKVKSQSFFSQIRGTKHRASRPTRMICDDVTHGTRVFSEALRNKEKRQYNTDIKQAAEPDTNHTMIGTPLHNDDLISSKTGDPTWESYKFKSFISWPKNMDMWDRWENIFSDPTIPQPKRLREAKKFYMKNRQKMDEGAEVLWPERESIYHLMLERFRIGRRAFNAEKQLEPFIEGESLFQRIHYFKSEREADGSQYFVHEDGKRVRMRNYLFQKFLAVDPATGERKKINSTTPMSETAIVMGFLHLESNTMYVNYVKMYKAPQSQVIEDIFQLERENKFTMIAFEENLYRDLYVPYMREVLDNFNKKHGFDIKPPITSVYATEKKEQRIYSIEPWVTNGRIRFNKYLAENFLTQLKDYPNCDRNDGLDALEILMKVSDPDNGFKAIKLSQLRKAI